MKRMGRWLFNLAAGVSLLALLPSSALIFRSHGTIDEFIRSRAPERGEGTTYRFVSWRGSLFMSLAHNRVYGGQANYLPWSLWSYPNGSGFEVDYANYLKQTGVSWHAGFAKHYFSNGTPTETGHWRFWLIAVPWWFVAALTSLAPLTWSVSHYRRRKRRSQGHCSICGYDLRATPERCPECGTIPPAAKEAVA